jgi:hypothetical protein
MKTPGLQKQPLDPQRIRRVPASGFSWIDRRFVREGFLERLPAEPILFYFFLVAVSDARGLSFYAEGTIARLLKLSVEQVVQSRARLLSAQLILYAYPLYQVLPLPPVPEAASRPVAPGGNSPRGAEPTSLEEILRMAAERGLGRGMRS